MVKKYFKNCERVRNDVKHLKHVHYSRATIVDDEVCPINSDDDTEHEKAMRNVEFVGFSTYIAAGDKPDTMGGFSAFGTKLSQQKVADSFLTQFARAGRQVQLPPLPEADPAPDAEPAPTAE